ncbi:MAG: hypothetical protein K8I00_01075 [Candidatus Omnitrophica bacterium]|nr:hypothetical protein [Candidatus Omnitrophota bacterium]
MSPQLSTQLHNVFEIFSAGLTDWGSLHPLVIHFPIVLLLIAPMFIIAGSLVHKSQKTLFLCALALMLSGTATMFLATSTGDAAAEILPANPVFVPTLEAHVRLAEQARLSFGILSGIFLLYMILSTKLNIPGNPKQQRMLLGLYLLIYAVALLSLCNAAHYGGKLVHEHGIRSSLYQSSPTPNP